jgi:putative membrane protein
MMDDKPGANRPAEPDPRVPLAAERTLLAWIRTGLAMMGFGFVVARFGLFLRELADTAGEAPPPQTGVSLGIGTALVTLGVAVNLLAALQHGLFLRRLRDGVPYRLPRWSMAMLVAVILALIGVGMTAWLVAVER